MPFGSRRIPKHLLLSDTPRKRKPRLAFLWWVAALALGFILVALAKNSQAQEMEDTGAGELLMSRADGEADTALQLSTHAKVEITGLIARVAMRQNFVNDSDDWREARYVFPLPDNAAVYAMKIQIGDRVIEAEIKERQEAKQIYEHAKSQGKIAALTEQQRPNLFTQKNANIPPHANISVQLNYQQTLRYDGGVFSWRLPTTLTPRYIPGIPLDRGGDRASFQIQASGWARDTDQVPDASAITPPMNNAPGHPSFSVSVRLHSGFPLASIESPGHEIVVRRNDQEHLVTLKNGNAPMDSDFVLHWTPAQGNAPLVAMFNEHTADGNYAQLMLLPPTSGSATSVGLARDIVFVIDTSGSMAGSSIEQAKASLNFALSHLKKSDRFNIIEFNSAYRPLYSSLQTAELHTISQAQHWVRTLRAEGGTEMLPALNAAFGMFRDSAQLQQLIFITDGAVGNEAELFNSIHKNLGSTRLFTVGIGAAPNAWFMRKSAEFGRGSYTFIGNIDEVSRQMQTLFKKLESAVATNIQVDWGMQAEQFPQKIGELYAGEPLLISAKLPLIDKDPAGNTVTIKGDIAGQAWRQNIRFDPDNNSPGIARVWARDKIEALEDQKIAGADAAEIRSQVLKLAIENKLVSPYTSFVAVDKTASNPQAGPTKSEAIANLMPKGNMMTVPFAKTATDAEITLFIGCFFFALFIFALSLRRDI